MVHNKRAWKTLEAKQPINLAAKNPEFAALLKFWGPTEPQLQLGAWVVCVFKQGLASMYVHMWKGCVRGN